MSSLTISNPFMIQNRRRNRLTLQPIMLSIPISHTLPATPPTRSQSPHHLPNSAIQPVCWRPSTKMKNEKANGTRARGRWEMMRFTVGNMAQQVDLGAMETVVCGEWAIACVEDAGSSACFSSTLITPSLFPLCLKKSLPTSLMKTTVAAGAVTVQTPTFPSSSPPALSPTRAKTVITNIDAPKIAPTGSNKASRGLMEGG